MDVVRLEQRADELRIILSGHLTGRFVAEVRAAWQRAQEGLFWHGVRVDLSALTGYDREAQQLLAEMYRRGVVFTAGTPESLRFLDEIAATANSTAAPPAQPPLPLAGPEADAVVPRRDRPGIAHGHRHRIHRTAG